MKKIIKPVPKIEIEGTEINPMEQHIHNELEEIPNLDLNLLQEKATEEESTYKDLFDILAVKSKEQKVAYEILDVDKHINWFLGTGVL